MALRDATVPGLVVQCTKRTSITCKGDHMLAALLLKIGGSALPWICVNDLPTSFAPKHLHACAGTWAPVGRPGV